MNHMMKARVDLKTKLNTEQGFDLNQAEPDYIRNIKDSPDIFDSWSWWVKLGRYSVGQCVYLIDGLWDSDPVHARHAALKLVPLVLGDER